MVVILPQRRKSKYLLLLLLVSLGWLALLSKAASDTLNYTRYTTYPDYCSTPKQMENRSIPPLREDVKSGETRLVHVTSVIRHGARTPLGHHTCWGGYWESPDTGVWDCRLRTLVATPPPIIIQAEEGLHPEQVDAATFLFEKKYDGLVEPDGTIGNVLNGTCSTGQLLLKGYEQSLLNGIYLRKAYLYDPNQATNHSERMRLLPQTYQAWSVRFRTDDDQRTLMSGQVLLRGMFGEDLANEPLISLHTADKSRDILSVSVKLCPRLLDLQAQAQESAEFQAFIHSKEAQLLRLLMKTELCRVLDHPLACLMTTICNDLPLPEVVDDFVAGQKSGDRLSKFDIYGTNRFQRLYDYDVKNSIFDLRYNDSAFAKLAMGPLWSEILEPIDIVTDKPDDDYSITRFSLFSAHDSTLSSLMSSLGPLVWNETDWPAFGSMMVLEVHEIVGGGHIDRTIFKSNNAFRLIYNGRVLTNTIDGCDQHADLCDWSVLRERLRPFAMKSRSCASDMIPIAGDPVAILKIQALFLITTPEGILLLVAVVLLSGFVGCVLMWWHLLGRVQPGRYNATTMLD
jgi:hypothetical protein